MIAGVYVLAAAAGTHSANSSARGVDWWQLQTSCSPMLPVCARPSLIDSSHLGSGLLRPSWPHSFVFGSQRHVRYSDNALRRMQNALDAVDMEQVWAEHRPRRRSSP